MEVEVRKVDSQGRVSLPGRWRKKALKESNEVIIVEQDGRLLIRPRESGDLTKFFDAFEVDVPPDRFKDYTGLKRALFGRSYE